MVISIQKLLSVLILFFSTTLIVSSQTPTIITDADPLLRERNLVFNGSFEEPHLENGFTFDGFIPGVDGDGYYFLSSDPGNVNIPIAQPVGWTTSGGGIETYGRWGNNYNAFPAFGLDVAGQAWSSAAIDGERSVYLGNETPLEISEEPTFTSNGEVVFTSPPTITLKPDYGPDPLTITQTVTGLNPGRIYRMSFFASGEWGSETFATSPNGTTAGDGIVGVDIEGYDRLYLAVPAGFSAEPAGAPHVFGTDEFHIYTLEFIATDTDMDISFMNWGHFDSLSDTIGWERGQSTETIIDDVIINSVDFVLNPIFPALDDNINFISAENATPDENVAFVWGKLPGDYTVGGRVCNGIELGIKNPKILAIERANEFGVATYIFYIPLFSDFEFALQLQAVDIETCRISNQIEQIMRKDDEGN